MREFDSRKEEEGIALLNSLSQSYGRLLDAGEADFGEMKVHHPTPLCALPSPLFMWRRGLGDCSSFAVPGRGLEDGRLCGGVHEGARS